MAYSPGSTVDKVAARTVGETVLRERAELASTQVALEIARQPRLRERFDDAERTSSLQDAQRQLSFLAAALIADSPALFIDHVGWAKVTLTQRGWAMADLAANLHCLCDALRFELPMEAADVAIGFVRDAIERLPSLPGEIPTYIRPRSPHALLARLFLKAMLRADLRAARGLILGAVEEGISERDIYLNVLQPAMYEVGRLWQMNQISVAREHFCTAAAQSILALLCPSGGREHDNAAPIVVTTCVAEEQHQTGIQMVTNFFETAGWRACYLGANTPADAVISELIERDADVLAVSMTMAHHLPQLAELVGAVRHSPQTGDIKVLVGGYPFRDSPGLCSTMDVDLAAFDAEQAVESAGHWFAAA